MDTTIEELKELKFIHLHKAFLCVNCEIIANETRDGCCSACGSTAVISLTRLLGGTVMPVPEEEMFFRGLRDTEGVAPSHLKHAIASLRRN
jgi:hypothetical protein